MPLQVPLSLRMLSDWHVGTGTARHGYVNSLITRDADGLPYVPAKTLIGVWRDACEVAAHAADSPHFSGSEPLWQRWVEYLFGTQHPVAGEQTDGVHTPRPRSATVRIRGGLHLPGELAAALRGRHQLAQAATFLKPGVSIDPVSGAAAEEMLRFDEMARAGVELRGVAEFDTDGLSEVQRTFAVTLLLVGAQLLESLGAKRRRGAGRCRLTVGPPVADLSWLAGGAVVPAPPEVSTAAGLTPAGGGAPGWHLATLHLTLNDPVVAQSRVVGNAIESYDHIPGWMLLPAVLSRLGPVAATLARRGDLVVTAATPEISGTRGLPAPRVIQRDKSSRQLINRAACTVEGMQMKAVRAGYVADDGALVLAGPVGHIDRMHNTIRDDVQRPTEDVGGVYTYQALPSGTRLQAEVWVRLGALSAGDWHTALAGEWRLGRSSKDDYGSVQVRATAPVAPAVDKDPPVTPLGCGAFLQVWLLSDTIVYDERLRPSTSPQDLARVLGEALGAPSVTLEPGPIDGDAGLVTTAMQPRRIDSWHRGWGLPRPTLVAFVAGSCLTLQVKAGQIEPEKLTGLEHRGIGQRRGEGFGRVRFNAVALTASPEDAQDKPQDPPPMPTIASGAAGYAEARRYEKVAWRAEIARRSEQVVDEQPSEVLGVNYSEVTATQLNSLRQLMPDLADEERVGRWLQRLAATDARRKKWPESAVDALHELVTTPTRVWEVLALPEQELTVTADGRAWWRGELRHEAIRHVLDAWLTRHATAGREGDR